MARERCGAALVYVYSRCGAWRGNASGAGNGVEPDLAPSHLSRSTDKRTYRDAAAEFGVRPKYRVLNKPLLRMAALFDPRVRESYEMLYQSDGPYLFDASKFTAEFGFAGTPYSEGIRITAASYQRKPGASR